jgi:TolB-like protein/DNA-binding winged helix-turn-helix (wHTH) protein
MSGMQHQPSTLLRVGAWLVDPISSQISRGNEAVRMEGRTMRLLMYLAERPGEVVSIDELLTAVWAGVIVTPDSVYQGIASLRRQLGDDPKKPSYIATVPRLGYRMVAMVTPSIRSATGGKDAPIDPMTAESLLQIVDLPASPRPRHIAKFSIAAVIIIIIVAATYPVHTWLGNRFGTASRVSLPKESVAVLPFLDLTTQEMNEEYFADGLTEELIGDLSGIAGLQVPTPTSSFYFKGKQLPIADIARQLGVAFVVDGSVRKSGNLYRVAVRLVRADNGYVLYSENYEKPLGDLLSAQKTIAAQAAAAIRNAIVGSERAESKKLGA